MWDRQREVKRIVERRKGIYGEKGKGGREKMKGRRREGRVVG